MGSKTVKSILIFTFFLFSTLFLNSLSAAKEPSKNLMIELIEHHYDQVIYYGDRLVSVGPGKTHSRLLSWSDKGVIRTVLYSGLGIGDKNRTIKDYMIGDVFRIEFIGESLNVPHFTTEKNIFFQVGTRNIANVIEIDSTGDYNYTVFFVFTVKMNSVGRILFPSHDNKKKYKGKAVFQYDLFTKKYLPREFYQSSWDTLNWKESNFLYDHSDGSKIIKTQHGEYKIHLSRIKLNDSNVGSDKNSINIPSDGSPLLK